MAGPEPYAEFLITWIEDLGTAVSMCAMAEGWRYEFDDGFDIVWNRDGVAQGGFRETIAPSVQSIGDTLSKLVERLSSRMWGGPEFDDLRRRADARRDPFSFKGRLYTSAVSALDEIAYAAYISICESDLLLLFESGGAKPLAATRLGEPANDQWKQFQAAMGSLLDALAGPSIDEQDLPRPPILDHLNRLLVSVKCELAANSIVESGSVLAKAPREAARSPKYLSPADCLARLPMDGKSTRQKRDALDRLRYRCPWIKRQAHGRVLHLLEDDFLLARDMLEERSASKTDITEAIGRMPTDPTEDEIKAAAARIREAKISRM